MSEIQHSTRSHARLNASSSHRWMMCPPSVKLSEQFADKPSPYAEEGTFLHELCELKLHRYLGDMTPEVLEAQYAEHRDNDFYSDEAENVTDEYVDFCIETIESVRASCPDPLILVEHRLDFSEYVPEGFGTGDLVIVADGVLEVVDFKGGRGVRVEADHNSQLMLYGLGALLEFDALYDIRTVRMTIVQPRLNNISTYETTADELIRWAKDGGAAQGAAGGEGRRRVLRGRVVPVLQGTIHLPQAQRVPHAAGRAGFQAARPADRRRDSRHPARGGEPEQLGAGPDRLRDAAGGGRQGLAGLQAGGRAQRAQVHQRGRGHQGRDGGRLHRHLQDHAAGRGRSGKAHGQEEVLRGAGQVRRQARGRAAARARKRSPQAVFRRGERFQ